VTHAHHFLERLDRVDREQTEFALSLYRDHEAVAFVLSRVNLPEGAARIALSVDDAREGPFVLVTRDGRFVTCLGRGMHHDHPVVPRPQLDALLAKVAEKRARRELAQRELRPDEEEGDLFQRILTRGVRLAREDFVALSAFEPMLGFGPFLAMIDLGVDAMKARGAMSVGGENATVKGTTKLALERLDRTEWAVAHLAVLSGAAERRDLDAFLDKTSAIKMSPSFACSAQGGSTFYLRGAWMAARFGKTVIPQYKAALVKAEDWMSGLDAALALAAIGIRHASAAGEVRRIFESLGEKVEDPKNSAEMRGNMGCALLDVMTREGEYLEAGIKMGRELATKLSGHLPVGHPLRFDTHGDVPDDVARTALLFLDGDMFDPRVQQLAVASLPTAARAAAVDFYHPREIVRAWYGAWTPEEALDRLKRFIVGCAKPVPVRVATPPGRNDPCTCGSGKKWKKCHGGSRAGEGPA
jgi:hypothetical protein